MWRPIRRFLKPTIQLSRKLPYSASNTASAATIPKRWFCGKRSSAILPTARRSSSTSSLWRVKTNGICSQASCCCCRTATKDKAPNIPAPVSKDFCSSPRATIFRFASRPQPRNIFICCAARRCARGASRSSSSRRRACCAHLLRRPRWLSFQPRRFRPVIPDKGNGTATRVLLCTGKIGHELEPKENAGRMKPLQSFLWSSSTRSPKPS